MDGVPIIRRFAATRGAALQNRRELAILFMTLFLLMLGVGIIIPNIAYHAQEHRASAFQISLLFTLYSLMQFLFAPFWGHLSDRVGRKPVLLLGLFGNAVGLALFGVSSGLPELYAARGSVMGVGRAPPVAAEPRFVRPWRAFSSPLLPFYLVAFFVTFAMAALESIFPLFIQDRFGFGARDMGAMFLFMGTGVVLVQGFLLGRWIGALGEENVMLCGLLVNALGFLLVIAATGRVSLTAALLVSGMGNQVM